MLCFLVPKDSKNNFCQWKVEVYANLFEPFDVDKFLIEVLLPTTLLINIYVLIISMCFFLNILNTNTSCVCRARTSSCT